MISWTERIARDGTLTVIRNVPTREQPTMTTVRKISAKAAQHLVELASIQQCITKMAIGSDGKFDSRQYALHKVEVTEALAIAIQGVLNPEAFKKAPKRKSNGTTRKSKD